jgi:hypothetical protein
VPPASRLRPMIIVKCRHQPASLGQAARCAHRQPQAASEADGSALRADGRATLASDKCVRQGTSTMTRTWPAEGGSACTQQARRCHMPSVPQWAKDGSCQRPTGRGAGACWAPVPACRGHGGVRGPPRRAHESGRWHGGPTPGAWPRPEGPDPELEIPAGPGARVPAGRPPGEAT